MRFSPRQVRAALAVLMVIAIGGGSIIAPAANARQATPEASPAASPAVESTSIPNTPAGDQLRWLLDQLNGSPATLTDEAVEERFADAFLIQVPVDQVREVLVQFAAAAPWSFVSVAEEQGPNFLKAIVAGSTGSLLVTILVEADPPHKMTGLLFEPAPAVSWDEVTAALAALGPEVGFLAAEVTVDGCRGLAEIDPDRRLAVGSTFKLYVLGELARQVAAGQASWDELLPIEDRYKSLPSGDLRHMPAGTEFTLRYYAETMIAQSDNTATDHLIARLGRENVETMMATMGHGEPSVNTPLLTTRELFVIKLGLSEDERQAYLAAPPADRRALLDAEIGNAELPGPEAIASFTAPLAIDELEWFASPRDACNAMAYLYGIGQEPGQRQVLEILSLGPPIAADRATWPMVLYKGGSEPGVLSETVLLVRQDGRAFVLTATVNNPDGAVDANAMTAAIQRAAGPLSQA